MLAPATACLCVAMLFCGSARADETSPFSLFGLEASSRENPQPEDTPLRDELAEDVIRGPIRLRSLHPPRSGFGTAGSRQLIAGLRHARDTEDNTDASLFFQRTWFVADDVEIGAEIAGWWFIQRDNTWGLGGSLVARYHFYQHPRISLFAEAGMGIVIAADTVPDDGTSLGLLPRIGVGATFPIFDSGTRLITGVHWHHISNARLNGEARNPARDSIGVYAGIGFPF